MNALVEGLAALRLHGMAASAHDLLSASSARPIVSLSMNWAIFHSPSQAEHCSFT